MKKIVGVLTVIYLMGFSSIQARDIDVVVDVTVWGRGTFCATTTIGAEK